MATTRRACSWPDCSGTISPRGVEVHGSAGDAGDLLALLAGADRVVLIDAARGGTLGTSARVPLGAVPQARSRSTHGLSLAEALGVASELGILPAVVSVYVVHGRRFDLGPVTPEVGDGIRAAAELIVRDELG